MAWACSRRCQTSWLSGEQARNSMQCPDGQSLAQAQQGVRPIGHASCLIGGAHVVVRPSPAMVGPVPKAASITVRMQPIRGQPDFGSISTVWVTDGYGSTYQTKKRLVEDGSADTATRPRTTAVGSRSNQPLSASEASSPEHLAPAVWHLAELAGLAEMAGLAGSAAWAA
jgi:hypothetical protein